MIYRTGHIRLELTADKQWYYIKTHNGNQEQQKSITNYTSTT